MRPNLYIIKKLPIRLKVNTIPTFRATKHSNQLWEIQILRKPKFTFFIISLTFSPTKQDRIFLVQTTDLWADKNLMPFVEYLIVSSLKNLIYDGLTQHIEKTIASLKNLKSKSKI